MKENVTSSSQMKSLSCGDKMFSIWSIKVMPGSKLQSKKEKKGFKIKVKMETNIKI